MPRQRLIHVAALIAAMAVIAALPAASAVAQDDPSSAQYDAPIPDDGSGMASASDSGGDEASGLEAPIGFLPFTGLDLLIVSGVALVLGGTGFALRRAVGNPSG